MTDGRPENSRAAIRAAIAHGYGIEIDVQLSADNQAMVFHDYALDRLAHGSGPVRVVPAGTLGQTPLRGGDEGIPTLPEVLEIVAGQVPLLIEIKDQDGAMGDNLGPLEEATAAALGGYDGPVALMSFNPHIIARMAALCPDIPRGLVTSAYTAEDWPLNTAMRDHLRGIPDFDRVGASFISHEAADPCSPARCRPETGRCQYPLLDHPVACGGSTSARGRTKCDLRRLPRPSSRLNRAARGTHSVVEV